MSSPIMPHEQHYPAFLNDVKSRIRKARIHVAKTANRELIQLYWWLGQVITEITGTTGLGQIRG
ncbi:MAG: hypothetical protein O7D86_09245 [Proteobacteria bacterium]|nr:hypothetical protein [Pseudomonadota bacterium]